MPAPLPSLDLVRRVTDQHVLDRLLAEGRLTRAELAARTGISKPTVSESVRRLAEASLVVEGGTQTGGRGRSGTYVRLRPELGTVLAGAVGPEGVTVLSLDPAGTVLGRATRSVPSPATEADLGPVLLDAVDSARSTSLPVLATAVSLAGPVAQPQGRLVALPDSPFVLGSLDARSLLAGHLTGPVGSRPDGPAAPLEIDNDVNWAALAEHADGAAVDLEHFVYLYLGPGLGAAVVSDGRVLRGAGGLAGEVAHFPTSGPGGRSMRLVDCFAAWGLRRPGAAAIDLGRLTAALTDPSEHDVRAEVVTAVAGVVCGLIAVLNPGGVVIGGPWAETGGVRDAVAERVARDAVTPTEVRPATLGDAAPLLGARRAAVTLGRQALVDRLP